MDKIPLSVVVLTHNEERNIKECLDSVKGWVEEIVVVDDYSRDNTLPIVKHYTDKIYQRRWDREGRQRNFAYSKAGCEYVLSLDADERVSPELKEELLKLFARPLEYAGYNIPHRNYFGTYWVKYGGWYPNAKLKLFKRDKFYYEPEAEYHPRAFLDGSTFTLKGDIIHYNYQNFHSAFAKLNHQTDFEARKWIRDGRKMSLGIALRKICERFIKFYFIKRGFLDGFLGFFLALYSGMYQFFAYCKYWEIKKGIAK